jgi:hypothetical protein
MNQKERRKGEKQEVREMVIGKGMTTTAQTSLPYRYLTPAANL